MKTICIFTSTKNNHKMKNQKVKVAKNLHPRVLSGINGTVAGVYALAKSLNKTK